MLFAKHINRYYLKSGLWLLAGLAALLLVDYFQLIVPELYRMTVNGINDGTVELNGALLPFDTDFLLDHICRPMFGVILAIGTHAQLLAMRGSYYRLYRLQEQKLALGGID